jgi:hypothetical protein
MLGFKGGSACSTTCRNFKMLIKGVLRKEARSAIVRLGWQRAERKLGRGDKRTKDPLEFGVPRPAARRTPRCPPTTNVAEKTHATANFLGRCATLRRNLTVVPKVGVRCVECRAARQNLELSSRYALRIRHNATPNCRKDNRRRQKSLGNLAARFGA